MICFSLYNLLFYSFERGRVRFITLCVFTIVLCSCCVTKIVLCLHNIYDSFFEQSACRVTKLKYSEELMLPTQCFPYHANKVSNNFGLSLFL